MTFTDRSRLEAPSHAGFGPVLNIGHLPSVAFSGVSSRAAWSMRAGALVAGIFLAFLVLAIPGAVIALAVGQVGPSLAARNAPATSVSTPAATQSATSAATPAATQSATQAATSVPTPANKP